MRSWAPSGNQEYIKCIKEWEKSRKDTPFRQDKWEDTRERGTYWSEQNGHKYHEQERDRKQDNKQQRIGNRSDFTPTCFTCGKKGHKSPECPTKRKPTVASRAVHTVGHQHAGDKLNGKVGSKDCTVIIDSGAEKSIMSEDLVPEKDLMGRSITLSDFDDDNVRTYPLAKVWFHIDSHSFQLEVVLAS